MPNNKHYRAARRSAKEAYLSGERNVALLAETYGVSPRTIYNWIKTGRWDERAQEELTLGARAEVAAKRPWCDRPRGVCGRPQNQDLRSLVAFPPL